jgi:hypothetical protein
MAGRLLAERILRDGAEVPLGANHMRVAEVEFAFRMGQDLLPRRTAYETHEVLAAVEHSIRPLRFPIRATRTLPLLERRSSSPTTPARICSCSGLKRL